MDVIIESRGGGKTTKLIEWLRATPKSLFIAHSIDEADRLKRAYPDVAESIIDYQSWLGSKKYGAKNEEACIDNADLILQRIFGNSRLSVKKISISK